MKTVWCMSLFLTCFLLKHVAEHGKCQAEQSISLYSWALTLKCPHDLLLFYCSQCLCWRGSKLQSMKKKPALFRYCVLVLLWIIQSCLNMAHVTLPSHIRLISMHHHHLPYLPLLSLLMPFLPLFISFQAFLDLHVQIRRNVKMDL